MAKAWRRETSPHITEEAGVGGAGDQGQYDQPCGLLLPSKAPSLSFQSPKKQDQLVISSLTHEPVEAFHIQTTSFSSLGVTSYLGVSMGGVYRKEDQWPYHVRPENVRPESYHVRPEKLGRRYVFTVTAVGNCQRAFS